MVTQPAETTTRRKRSFWSKLLIAGLLLLGLNGWLQLWLALDNWGLLEAIGTRPGPLYLALSGGLLGLAGLAAGLGLWARTAWSPVAVGAVILLWLVWSWVDRLWLSPSPQALVNWPFRLIISLAIVIYTGLVLSAEKRKMR
jgi:hypothetical protein